MPRDIDLKITNREHFARIGLGFTHPRPNPSNQLGRIERLHHIIIGTGLKPPNHIAGVRPCRQHDDRRARILANLLAHLDAVHVRKHHIEQHQVRAHRSKHFNRFGAVIGVLREKTLTLQHHTQHLGERSVVVNHQYPCSHAPHYAWLGCVMAVLQVRGVRADSSKMGR